jgi:hypothetical protein
MYRVISRRFCHLSVSFSRGSRCTGIFLGYSVTCLSHSVEASRCAGIFHGYSVTCLSHSVEASRRTVRIHGYSVTCLSHSVEASRCTGIFLGYCYLSVSFSRGSRCTGIFLGYLCRSRHYCGHMASARHRATGCPSRGQPRLHTGAHVFFSHWCSTAARKDDIGRQNQATV